MDGLSRRRGRPRRVAHDLATIHPIARSPLISMPRNRIALPRIAALAALIALAAVFATRGTSQEAQHSYVPAAGFVPNAVTASAIAEAVLVPIYGRRQIEGQKPLTASLHGDRWIVIGHRPPNTLGGVAMVEIAKGDARILRVTHGR